MRAPKHVGELPTEAHPGQLWRFFDDREVKTFNILRFSLFEKDKIKPGDVVIKYNEIDLSKLEDDKLVKLHKQNQNVNLKILNANDLISLNSNNYFLNEIKLVRFDLD